MLLRMDLILYFYNWLISSYPKNDFIEKKNLRTLSAFAFKYENYPKMVSQDHIGPQASWDRDMLVAGQGAWAGRGACGQWQAGVDVASPGDTALPPVLK